MYIGKFMEYSIIAQAATGASSSPTSTLIMLGFLGVFLYLFMIRPEQKRRKRMDNMRKNLQKGDRVVAMGMKAIVDEVREKTVVLKQIDGAKIEMLIGAISEVEKEEVQQQA